MFDLINTPTAIDVKIIQARHDNAFQWHNKTRRAWKLQIHPAEKIKLAALAPEVRFAVYADLDREVQALHVQYMKQYHDEAIARGAKKVLSSTGQQVLEKAYQIDTDILLVHAATAVLSK